MFCPSCGKKNEKEAQFCEFCGSKIKDESKVFIPKKEKKSMSKRNKIFILATLVVVLVLGSAYVLLSNNYTPSKIAEGYFVALMSDDTNKLYNYINVPNSEFTSKKIFNEVVDNDDKNLVNYSIVSEQVSTDGLSAQVKISYTLEGRQTPLEKIIYLVKDKKNKMFLFDNWKISEGSSLLEEDYEIMVFKGATLKLEGVSVSKKYKKEENNQKYDTYVIPNLFKGDYDAQIIFENGLKAESKIDVSGYSSTVNTFELFDKDERVLENTIKDNVNKLYKSAIESKAFNDIKKDFEYKNANLMDLEESYEVFAKYIKSNGLKSYELTDLDVEKFSITEDNYLYVTVNLEYKYSINDYLSEDVVSKSSEDVAYLTYDYNDGFKLVDMTSLTTYFSRF